MAVKLLGLLTAILGLALIGFGYKLAAVGGSAFYVWIGLGLLTAGIQLARRRQSGFWLYALTLAAAFAWTIQEVGFDKWQWIPRGALILFLGLLLSLPFVPSGLRDGPRASWAPIA